MSIDPAENQKCKECNSVELDNLFRKTFKVNICKNCKEKYPEKYSLITKSEAKEVTLSVKITLFNKISHESTY